VPLTGLTGVASSGSDTSRAGSRGSAGRSHYDIATSWATAHGAAGVGSIAGLSATMLVVATLVMAVGAAIQAAVGLGLALFVVPLLALIDTRLVPGPMLLASIALAVMMAYRDRAAIDCRKLGLSLIGLCVGTAIGA